MVNNGVLDSVGKLFHSLYDKFVENPIMFTAFLFLCAGGFIVYREVDNLEDYLPTPEYENAQFDESLNRDRQINSALEDAKEFYGADGIVIGQFHNGQYDLTRLPFTKVSITYYVGNLNEDETGDLYDARPISTMNNIMLEMWGDKEKPICVSKNVDNLKDMGYRSRMQSTGMKFITLCPLTNLRGYPIGYMSNGYRFIPEEEEKEIILDYQRTLSSRIAGYLQEGAVRARQD
tara:strand:+ start:637 stop:1335 length:699 start_codon:yes stop_codon:yes gene_type:complete